MNRLLSTLVLGLASVAAFADEGSDIKAINAKYRALEAAISSKNLSRVFALGTEDFTWVNPNGQVVGRAELRKMMADQFNMPSMKFHKITMKPDSYGFMGNECTVRCNVVSIVSMPMNGKTTKMRGVTECVDTWRRTPGGWRISKVEVTSETFGPG